MSASANGEGSSRSNRTEGTLDDVLRDPSRVPEVVLLKNMPQGLETKEILDPKEDLWLATNDGRYSSPIIPVRVGTAPYQETFHVHRDILLKAEWFRKALCGGFMEALAQSLDLPEEDPAIFHFLIAYLYEDRYVPTKPLATVLIPDEDKGKGRENENDSSDADSDSTASIVSDSSTRSRRHRARRRRREEREIERLREKHPGRHRPNCPCPQCRSLLGPPCWSCLAPRVPPPIAAIPPAAPPPPARRRSRDRQHRRRGSGRAGESPPSTASPPDLARIKGEDLRTWLIEYELNLDVYICANKFLLDDFKKKIARVTVDMLETAGADAAQVEVLHFCQKLYEGVSDHDSLLKMVFARVGFLQGALWRKAPAETNEFLVENPEVAALILKETAIRGEEDLRSGIPSMERGLMMMPPPPLAYQHHRGPHPRGLRYNNYYL